MCERFKLRSYLYQGVEGRLSETCSAFFGSLVPFVFQIISLAELTLRKRKQLSVMGLHSPGFVIYLAFLGGGIWGQFKFLNKFLWFYI